MSAEPETVAIDAVGHIVRTEGVVSGRPRIAGTRIRVLDVAVQLLKHGRSVREVVEQFGVTEADVHAAMVYFYDYRDEVERADEDDEQLIRQLQEKHPERVNDRSS